VDLPTYTNIWRIEKRLYKLYDFRLPAPLPITWIAVFTGITVPYIFFLVVIGLPFNHNLVWLYVLPPALLTWLTTRPVIESKRLPELVSSQLRYLAEPRTWCRMAPLAEKDEIFLSARVWYRYRPSARPKAAGNAPAQARRGVRPKQRGRVLPASAANSAGVRKAALPKVAVCQLAESKAAGQAVASPYPSWQAASIPQMPAASPPEAVPLAVPQRATAQPAAQRTRVAHRSPLRPAPDAPPPARVDELPGAIQRATWPVSPPDRKQDARALEVSHDPEPDRDLGESSAPFASASWPSSGAGALHKAGAFAEPEPFPEAGPFPEYIPFPGDGAFPGNEPLPDPDPAPLSDQAEPAAPAAPAAGQSTAPAEARSVPARPGPPMPEPDIPEHVIPAPVTSAPVAPASGTPAPARPPAAGPGRSVAAKVAALFVDFDGDRSVPSIERALSAQDGLDDAGWRRRVKVVTGGQGPARQGQQVLDRDRARLPLTDSCRIAVLGCTTGAGQSTTALMIGHVLAAVREVPVAALDLNPGDTSLATRITPATSVTALLAGRQTDGEDPAAQSVRGSRTWRTRREPAARLDVIAAESPRGNGARALDPDDYQQLARVLAARYPVTVIDPALSGLPRVLPVADQLVLVVPARLDAATSLANTQQWLSAHGYDELAGSAVTVVNGVSQRTSPDVLRAESVARGRCRAIVRVPWDDLLSAQPGARVALSPQTKRAYAALAGVLVAGLAAAPGTADPANRVRGRSPGEHSD
jgi:MinD-like ATPase involved in chromosome partitioning or flagellar assembly